jgi:methionine-rich copper-binding protein CopC
VQTVYEGIVAQVTAQLSAPTTVAVTVPFTVGGTATSGSDFTTTPAPPTLLTIPAGSTLASVTVTIVNDGAAEPDETVVFTLGTPTNATLGATTVHTITISGGGDVAPSVAATTPANNATNFGTQAIITITFSEPVTATGSWFQIVCATTGTRTVANSTVGGGPTTYTIDPTTDFAVNEQCTATVFAAQVADTDAFDPPDQMAANSVFTFTTDTPPAVQSTNPTNGATAVPASTNMVIAFTEAVNVTGASFTLTCQQEQRTFAVNGSGTNQITLEPTTDLPGATACTVTVVANQVLDADTGDPPDLMTEDYSFGFSTVDAAPTVATTSPPNNGAAGMFDNIIITFSEDVTVTGSWFQIACATSGTRNTTNAAVGGGPLTYTIDPNDPFAAGEVCTVTVVATQVTDNDVADPPNEMVADYVFSFTTDSAPFVTGSVPANGATGVLNDTNITITFSEPVDLGPNAFSIECPLGSGAVPFTVSGTGTTTAVLDPTSGLPANATCTVTAFSVQVTDADLFDPPNTLVPNGEDDNGRPVYRFSFTTIDAAPSVTGSVPANGATGVLNDTNITVNFSEPVNLGPNAFSIECPLGSGPVAFTVTGNGTSTAVLDPTGNLPAGVTCTVTAVSNQISDVDTSDPPNNLIGNTEDDNGRPVYRFTFTTSEEG